VALLMAGATLMRRLTTFFFRAVHIRARAHVLSFSEDGVTWRFAATFAIVWFVIV